MADERTYVYALVAIVGFVAFIAWMQHVGVSDKSLSVGNAYSVPVSSEQDTRTPFSICEDGVYHKGSCYFLSDVFSAAHVSPVTHDNVCKSLGADVADKEHIIFTTLANTRGCGVYPTVGSEQVVCFSCIREVDMYGYGSNGR